MSQENVEICRRAFAAFQAGMARGDFLGAFDAGTLAADSEWLPPPGFPGPDVVRGPEGFAEFMRAWVEDFDNLSIDLVRFVDAGDDQVVGLFHQHATGKGSGAPVELEQGVVYELEAGLIIRMRNFLDHSEALEAVGLSE